VATLAISARVASAPRCSLVAASTGTKAWLNAPSANRRRNRLGMRNATLKASVSTFAPNIDAMSKSRTSPVMREARVSKETVEAALRSDTGGSVCAAGLAPPAAPRIAHGLPTRKTAAQTRAKRRAKGYNARLC